MSVGGLTRGVWFWSSEMIMAAVEVQEKKRKGEKERERREKERAVKGARTRDRPWSDTKSPTGIEVTAAQAPGYVTRRARPRCYGYGQIRTVMQHECSIALQWILTASRVSTLARRKKIFERARKRWKRELHPSCVLIINSPF